MQQSSNGNSSAGSIGSSSDVTDSMEELRKATATPAKEVSVSYL
jgi:hypothetical protein